MFGMLTGGAALDAFFQPCLSGLPGNGTAALLRLSSDPGPLHDDVFEGFDWPFLLNLTDAPLADPPLGVAPTKTDGDWLSPLLSDGWTRDAALGGGDAPLRTLGPHGVHATLISSTGPLFNASVAGEQTSTGVPPRAFTTLDVFVKDAISASSATGPL